MLQHLIRKIHQVSQEAVRCRAGAVQGGSFESDYNEVQRAQILRPILCSQPCSQWRGMEQRGGQDNPLLRPSP